jgi:hypothetical protein
MTATLTVCPAGHPMTGPDADVYQPANGKPVCRPCRRVTQAAGRNANGTSTRRRRVLEPGAWVRVARLRGTFRVHSITGGEVNCFGGDKSRRQWHTFTADAVTLTRAPDWARDLTDPTA